MKGKGEKEKLAFKAIKITLYSNLNMKSIENNLDEKILELLALTKKIEKFKFYGDKNYLQAFRKQFSSDEAYINYLHEQLFTALNYISKLTSERDEVQRLRTREEELFAK